MYASLQLQYTTSVRNFVKRDGPRLLQQAEQQQYSSSVAKRTYDTFSAVMSEGTEAVKHLENMINELVPPQRYTLEFLAATLLKLRYWMLQCTAAALIAPAVVVPVAAPLSVAGAASAVDALTADSETASSISSSS
eukprot:7969-Heterococcus_DN1.PRE.1